MRTLFAIVALLVSFCLQGQTCFTVERYISGEYYDDFELCTDADNDITIDLEALRGDGSDLFYIPIYEGNESSNRYQYVSGRGWMKFYSNVTIKMKEDIYCDDFVFDCNDYYASMGFTFEVGPYGIYCDNMTVTNPNYREYMSLSCESTLYASETIYFNYSGQPLTFYGTIKARKMTVRDGNSTQIKFGDCCVLKADTLSLRQSSQNRVEIDGHLIVETLESTANLELEYEDAILTVGDLPSRVKLFCGENTTVNLCKNRTSGADNMGYFKGTVLYANDGWPDETPSSQGDINYKNYSSDYWVWRNSGVVPTEIAAYSGYEACMEERVDFILGIDKQVSESEEEAPEVREESVFYNILGQRVYPRGDGFQVLLKANK